MNAPKQENLDRDLDRIEARYRKLAGDRPPDMLDEAILNRARRAVEPAATRPWSFGWMHATATVALLVIGLTLVLQQRDELVPETGIPVTQPPDRDAIQLDQSPANEPRTKPDPGPGEAMSTETQEREQWVRDEVEHSPAAPRVQQDQDDPARSESATQTPPPPAMKAHRSETSKRLEDTPEAGAMAESFRLPDSEDGHISSEMDDAREAVRQAQLDAEAEKQRSEPQREPPSLSDQPGPDAWLADIERMRAQDGNSDWLQELQRFIAAYPDYPLPESLKQALQNPDTP